MRMFKKIAYEQFIKDFSDDKELYDNYLLPRRSTIHAAAYDFFALNDYTLKPGEIKKIPTGVKVIMEPDDVLLLLDRSSMGFKYNVRFCNQVGVIDADYYDNEDNNGHMWICIQNEGNKDYIIKKGDKMCQGMFVKYLKTDDDDDTQFIKRKSEY